MKYYVEQFWKQPSVGARYSCLVAFDTIIFAQKVNSWPHLSNSYIFPNAITGRKLQSINLFALSCEFTNEDEAI